MSGPVEEKVKWATAASYLAGLVVTALANAAQDEDHALLLGFLPEWLESLLLPLLISAPTLYAGWQAKHTHRPDLRRPDGTPI
jgi:hypothetical protein